VTIVVTVACAALGVLVGAFGNVVIDRVPSRASLRGPREGEASAPVEVLGVPLQPWLLRAGRGGLPGRWLAVEVATAASFAVVAARYGASLVVIPLLVLAAALVMVTVVDLQLLRIPDRITFPALGLSIPLVVAVSLWYGEPDALRGAAVGMVAYFVLLFVPHLVYPKGMGFGDVKLALLMGLHLGWLGWSEAGPVAGPVRVVLYALIAGSALGAVFGIIVSVATRRRGAFPFGPALAAACLLMVLLAPELRL
jgi:leader peptidase (prepilin peptidase) / N-methyltransferase